MTSKPTNATKPSERFHELSGQNGWSVERAFRAVVLAYLDERHAAGQGERPSTLQAAFDAGVEKGRTVAPIAEPPPPVAGEPARTDIEWVENAVLWSTRHGEGYTRQAWDRVKAQLATVEAERDMWCKRALDAGKQRDDANDKKRLGDQREASLLDDIKQAESALVEANARAGRLVDLISSSAPLTWAASADTAAAHEWEKLAEWVLSGAKAAETAQSPKQAGEPVAGERAERLKTDLESALGREYKLLADYVCWKCGAPPIDKAEVERRQEEYEREHGGASEPSPSRKEGAT